MHDRKQSPHEQCAEEGYECSDDDGKSNRIADGAAHSGLIAGAEFLSDRNAETNAAPHSESENEETDGTGRADGCKCSRSETLTDDNSVGHGINLLKDVADHDRNAELNDQPHRAAFGHVLLNCHRKIS